MPEESPFRSPAEGTTQRLVPRARFEGLDGAEPRVPRRGPRRGTRLESDAVALRARGVGGILDTALEILVTRFAPCVAVAALFMLPVRVIGESLPADEQLLWQFSYLLPELLTTTFVCSLVGGHLMGKRVRAGVAFREGFAALPGMIALWGVQLAMAIGLVCLCVFPAILAYWFFAVIPVVYVLERRRLVREADLGPGARWGGGVVLSVLRGVRLVFEFPAFLRWLGWSVVGYLAVLAPLQSSSGVLDHPAARMAVSEILPMGGRAVWYTLAAIGAVFAGIGTAYLAILKTVYYVDQRVRREGLDLELALQAVAPLPSPPGPGAGRDRRDGGAD